MAGSLLSGTLLPLDFSKWMSALVTHKEINWSLFLSIYLAEPVIQCKEEAMPIMALIRGSLVAKHRASDPGSAGASPALGPNRDTNG